MKATRTDETNVELTLPGDKTGDRTLPAARIRAYDPDMGETEADARPAFESWWVPDPDERIWLAQGAPLKLTITGERHPPVSLAVPPMPDHAPTLWLGWDHVVRALGWTHVEIEKRAANGEQIDPDAHLRIFEEALKETAKPPDQDGQASLEDVTLEDSLSAQHPDWTLAKVQQEAERIRRGEAG